MAVFSLLTFFFYTSSNYLSWETDFFY